MKSDAPLHVGLFVTITSVPRPPTSGNPRTHGPFEGPNDSSRIVVGPVEVERLTVPTELDLTRPVPLTQERGGVTIEGGRGLETEPARILHRPRISSRPSSIGISNAGRSNAA